MDPVKTGLVGLRFGAGLAASRVFGTENEKYIRIVAACDMKKDKADAFAQKYNLAAYYDLDQMLDSADI